MESGSDSIHMLRSQALLLSKGEEIQNVSRSFKFAFSARKDKVAEPPMWEVIDVSAILEMMIDERNKFSRLCRLVSLLKDPARETNDGSA